MWLVLISNSAAAECLGDGYFDELGGQIFSALIYLAMAITFVVFLLRRKHRAARNLVLGVLLVGFGLSLLGQAWQAWKHSAMRSREVLADPT